MLGLGLALVFVLGLGLGLALAFVLGLALAFVLVVPANLGVHLGLGLGPRLGPRSWSRPSASLSVLGLGPRPWSRGIDPPETDSRGRKRGSGVDGWNNGVILNITMSRQAATRPEEQAPAARVRDALAAGELGLEDLTARRLAAFVGKTTSVLYHHYGSLEGFLHAVAQEGFRDLESRLDAVLGATGALEDVAAAFVAYGLDRPALYFLMLERHYDWDAVRHIGRRSGSLPGVALFERIVTELQRAGSSDAETDVRLLSAGLHGLVSLAASGRANVGALDTSDRDIALRSARELTRRVCPGLHSNNEPNDDQEETS